ncbi:hypothetical protein LSH36_202g12016 [Paralvinella palmiformis]|uniref:Ig-like domain-containing protein n=1 Tax=Paralvinella palmiformis TaxID=53620 RepID=A0AAD9JPQ4_9ANNE|nr:hypothetical protein LSH36_202g12016 [Paralvinella palmiformis]
MLSANSATCPASTRVHDAIWNRSRDSSSSPASSALPVSGTSGQATESITDWTLSHSTPHNDPPRPAYYGTMSRTHKPRESKPSFIIPPRRQFIDEGGRAKFKTSFDGEPEPTVTWMKDKAVLKNGGKYKMYNKDSFYFLELLSVDPDDNGNYRCVITNRLGTAEVSAELEVFCKPKPRTLSSFSSRVEPSFDKELTDATTTEGSTLKLECLLKGHPKPFVQWYFNGKILRRSHGAREAFDDARATLTIKNVCQKHAGRYECQASNILGEVKTTCAITVRAPSSTSPSVEMKGASLDQKEAKEQPSEMLMNNESGSTEDGDSLHEGKRTVLESTRKKETVEAAGVKEGTSQKESSVQKGVRGEEEQRAGNAEQGPLNREVRAAKKDKAPPTGEIEPKEKRRREASVEKKSWDTVVGEIIGGKEEHQMEKTKGKDSAAIIREELSEKDEKLTRGSQRPAIEENQLTEPQDTVIGENVQLAKKDQPPEERQRVTPGKEQLTEERVQLTEEKEQLTEEKEPVTEEKEQLTKEKEPLTEEKEQLTEEKEQLTKEKEQLTKENEQLTKENEQLTKEKEQLTKEKEQLSVGKECLTKESEHQIEEKDQSSKEKDQMTEVKYPSAEETKTFRDVKDQPTEESVQSSSEETKLLTKEKLTEEEKQIEEKLKLSEETELSRVDNETLTMKKEQLITSGEPSVPETEILASNEKPFAAKNESVTDKKEYNEPSPVKLPYDAIDNELVMAASESSRHEEEEPFSSKSTTYAATDSARNLPETVITHGVLEDTVISVNKPLQNKTVKVGDAAILECQIWGLSAVAMATGSQSEPSVSWTKDDHELVPSDSLKMEVSGDRAWIEMKNTRKGDGGEYMCVVRRGTVKVWTSCVLTVDAGGGECLSEWLFPPIGKTESALAD